MRLKPSAMIHNQLRSFNRAMALQAFSKSATSVEIAENMTQQQNPDRRLIARSSISSGGGLLFFNSRQGVRGVRVIDISHRGVRLRTHRLVVLPIEFQVTWDNFATVQSCRLVWRWGELVGAVFEA
jgi:hypothetical protein